MEVKDEVLKSREVLVNYLRQSFIGPEDELEVLTSGKRPHNLYLTGALYSSHISNLEEKKDSDESKDNELSNEYASLNDQTEADIHDLPDEVPKDVIMFPSSAGLTVYVKDSLKKLKVLTTFGTYKFNAADLSLSRQPQIFNKELDLEANKRYELISDWVYLDLKVRKFKSFKVVTVTLLNVATPEEKLERLALHLNCVPKFILIGEAPGYQGCRYSGVAFTSERLLLEGSIPRIPKLLGRLTSRELSFTEPSATIVWKTLRQLAIAENVILWNAIQLHPHKLNDIHTNRTPTLDEVKLGGPALRLLIEAFPKAKIVAVGKEAEGLMLEMGIKAAGAVRHPANGGATKFAVGLKSLI